MLFVSVSFFRKYLQAAVCASSTALVVCSVANVAYAANLPRESRVPGGVAIVDVGPVSEPAPVVTRDGQRVWVTKGVATQPSKDKRKKQKITPPIVGDSWVAVIGIPLSAPTGEQTLFIKTANDEVQQKTFAVDAKQYTIQRLTIPDNRKVEPLPIDEERIAKEQPHIRSVMRQWNQSTTTDAKFIIPAQGRLSSRFGLKRVLNGKPRSSHAGLDVAVPTGTPIQSAGDGVILDVGDYFFNGKTVFVDHGNGLITMYIHLSEIGVKVGDIVKQGQSIGLSGMTGRATGPHLHWSVLLNGVMVEPELFIASLPAE